MRRILVVLPVLLIALGAASACGSDSKEPAAGSSPTAGGSAQRFAACMRDHGQNVADPDPANNGMAVTPPAGGDQRAWQTALRACQQYMPNGGEPAAPDPNELEGLRQYAACMRDHGVELTDPDPNTGKSQFGGRFANADRNQILNDPTYKAADAACKDKLETGGKKGGK